MRITILELEIEKFVKIFSSSQETDINETIQDDSRLRMME